MTNKKNKTIFKYYFIVLFIYILWRMIKMSHFLKMNPEFIRIRVVYIWERWDKT